MNRSKPEVFNTETFIAKSKRIFGDYKFDYSKVEYKNAKTKIKLRCVEHDLWFETIPDSHNRLDKKTKRHFGGCPECRRSVLGKYRKLSRDEFIKRATIIHDNKYDYSKVHEFKHCHDHVIIVCPIHSEFRQLLTNHLHNGFGCPLCGDVSTAKKLLNSQQSVIDRFVERYSDCFDYSNVNYVNFHTLVEIRCKEHDNIFLQSPQDHLRGNGCRKCLTSGYNILKPAYLYINKLEGIDVIKIGITNGCPSDRCKKINSKCTYEVRNIFSFYDESGQFILDLETKILRSFKFGVIEKELMLDGFSETTNELNLPEIIDMVVYFFNNREKLKE